MEFSDQADEQLMDRAADGDLVPLDELLRRHQQRLLHFLSRLAGAAAAEELFERTFTSLYRARRLYDPSIRFSTLLFGTAYAQARSWTPGSGEELGGAPADPLSLEARDGKIRRAMADLPLAQRAALHLCLFDNLGFAQAGQCLQVSEMQARVLVNQATQRLRESLGDAFP